MTHNLKPNTDYVVMLVAVAFEGTNPAVAEEALKFTMMNGYLAPFNLGDYSYTVEGIKRTSDAPIEDELTQLKGWHKATQRGLYRPGMARAEFEAFNPDEHEELYENEFSVNFIACLEKADAFTINHVNYFVAEFNPLDEDPTVRLSGPDGSFKWLVDCNLEVVNGVADAKVSDKDPDSHAMMDTDLEAVELRFYKRMEDK